MILVLDLKEVIDIGDLHAAAAVSRNSPDVKRPGD
jgi:hypothetical protein